MKKLLFVSVGIGLLCSMSVPSKAEPAHTGGTSTGSGVSNNAPSDSKKTNPPAKPAEPNKGTTGGEKNKNSGTGDNKSSGGTTTTTPPNPPASHPSETPKNPGDGDKNKSKGTTTDTPPAPPAAHNEPAKGTGDSDKNKSKGTPSTTTDTPPAPPVPPATHTEPPKSSGGSSTGNKSGGTSSGSTDSNNGGSSHPPARIEHSGSEMGTFSVSETQMAALYVCGKTTQESSTAAIRRFGALRYSVFPKNAAPGTEPSMTLESNNLFGFSEDANGTSVSLYFMAGMTQNGIETPSLVRVVLNHASAVDSVTIDVRQNDRTIYSVTGTLTAGTLTIK